jgi:hypothetical protein
MMSALISLFGFGCCKPGAQAEADRLALQITSEAACAQALRQWFVNALSNPPRETEESLSLPTTLQSEWWKSSRAHAVLSKDGKLQRITVARQPWESYVIIGPLDSTPTDLGLASRAGERPVFYARVARGIYTCTPYYE